LIRMKYSFPKLTQFSQGNSVLDAPTFDTDCFFMSDTCVIQLNWVRLLEQKEPNNTRKILIGRKYFFQN
jgi:hypothetical protein